MAQGGGCALKIYKDAKAPIEERVNDLVSRMTLEEKVQPVSYTHLDVYKRQLVCRFQQFRIKNLGSLHQSIIIPADSHTAFPFHTANGLHPVSYTHLDVYKRQVLPVPIAQTGS